MQFFCVWKMTILIVKNVFYFFSISGLSAHCDARNNGTQCSGTLGETVFLRLIHNASGIKIDLLKGNVILLQWRKNITVANEIKDRFDFIPDNGTFRINDLRRNDSGEYKIEMFDRNGKNTGWKTLQLFVQGNQVFLF
uniref:Natural killer cell receptor 2B4 immunoglobulin domain-containing protein n=1 Tax=Poecilia mexicana TaxID=48701 RepID=A0A3B3WVK0_9TELE